ncbi:hypothetical protein [Mycolicibacterium porcinum]|uniref:PQQ-binding-like beta-propeller repeat protein n=2 Tax=Mycolicibacterium porcinum TaxID=39693 RepID=A0ABV3VFG4_9MYCO
MSGQESQAEDEQGSTSRQFSIPVGLMFGLLAAAVLCLGYAWLHHDPQVALYPDPGAIDSMLWRTTIVVGVSAALVFGGYVAGGLNRIRGDWRAQFLVYVSAALVILAISGLLMLRIDGTKDVFDAAQAAQEALIPFDVATVARWAWWCACLAVIALVLVAVAGHGVPPIPRPLWGSHLLAGAVALAVVIIVAVSVLATSGQAMGNVTASRIEAPALSSVDGAVAYRVQEPGSTPLPAGAGFVRVIQAPTGKHEYSKANTIEGYDGVTGQRRWAYGPVDRLSVLGSTGIGPDSVVLAQAADTILIGIDATTGTPLWFKPGETIWDPEQTFSQLSPNVMIAVRPNPAPPGGPISEAGTLWEALSPRTGEVLWTKKFGYQCYPRAYVTRDFVAARSCENAPGVVADVYDAQTGAVTEPVRLSALGVNPAEIESRKGSATIDDVSDDGLLVSVKTSQPESLDRRFVVNIASGAVVRQLPDNRAAAFIDTGSVLLGEFRGRYELSALSILDLATGAPVPVGYSSDSLASEAGYRAVVRAGKKWWTLVPGDESAKTRRFSAGLRSINADGSTQDFQAPCPQASDVPAVTVAAGALLVGCGGGEWAAIR